MLVMILLWWEPRYVNMNVGWEMVGACLNECRKLDFEVCF